MKKIILFEQSSKEFKDEIIKSIKDELKSLLFNNSDLSTSEKYYTREQTAELLSVNLTTLWNWKKKGLLTPYGIGRRVYYRASDIEKAMVELIKE